MTSEIMEWPRVVVVDLIEEFDTDSEPEPLSETCGHCQGSGQCDCLLCQPSREETLLRVPGHDMGDDIDVGRQNEATCRVCNGLGRIQA